MNQTTTQTKKKIENKNLKLKTDLQILSPPISKKKIKNRRNPNSSLQKIPQIKLSKISKNGFERILETQITEIMQFELLNETELIQLCEKAKEIFMKETNVLNIESPLTVVGDLHGQFDDLLQIFNKGGFLPDTKYLFLGDYIDRGSYSIETISLLIALKVRYPDHITILRGNHESKQTSRFYGFYDECLKKYGNMRVWNLFTDLFDSFPLAAIISNKIFAIHGGLSPDISKVDQIQKIFRFIDIPFTGPLCDLVWSDPDERTGFNENQRGAGFTFGPNITTRFLKTNKLNLIVRAHQLFEKGYNLTHSEKCVTIFSAPNYCGTIFNLGSIMKIESQLETEIVQFEENKGKNPKPIIKW
ncbi:serine/threonine-protein phosphatase pp2a-related [Anaeramoeba flamelloides]|uniref:Serine/threonine-protein phosphatase n=1 Tax=Anaeramoeba flamelloides TaxID=1746091 RepID=A0ABQ8Y233_9EUKA|nr:serine/threonine-protein phosphatase pp2a-related [Anaeramoeba flamelloides]